MTFGDLAEGSCFTRGNNLIWRKSNPFRAYGRFIQNAVTKRHPGPWHYDSIRDDEEVELAKEEDFQIQVSGSKFNA